MMLPALQAMAGAAAAESFFPFMPRAFSAFSPSPSAPFLCACSPSVAFHRPADSFSTKPEHDLHRQQKLLLHQIALEVDKEKDKRPFAPSVRVLFDSLKSVQDVEQVRSLLDGLYFPLPVFCSVIRKLGSSKLPRSAFSVYEWLQTRDEKPDIFIYSSVLGVIQRSGEFEFVSRVMEHMKMNGVEPDLVAYKIIISSYEHMGLHQEAMATLEELLGKGLVLDDMATFRILLEGSEKAMDINSALRLYTLATRAKNSDDADADDVVASQFKATVSGIAYRTIRSMLGSLQGSSSCADILELIDRVEGAITDLCLGDYQGIIWCCGRAPEDHMVAYRMLTRPKPYPVSVSVCNHAMNILGKANKWEASLDVFERMLAHGPTPDRDSYLLVRSQFNSLLSSSREVRNSRWTLEILERMESQGIVPDQYAWDTSLITCAKRADLDGALLVFERMVEKGHVPSLISYGALLTSLEKCGFLEEAEQVWHHMKKLGIKPNIEAYTIMISVYSKASDQKKLLLLLDEMIAGKVEFTLITYNALITSCAKFGDGKGALKWMERLVEDGFQPNNISYDQVVKALSQAGEPELAHEMCIEANRLKLTLSESAYTALDSASKQ